MATKTTKPRKERKAPAHTKHPPRYYVTLYLPDGSKPAHILRVEQADSTRGYSDGCNLERYLRNVGQGQRDRNPDKLTALPLDEAAPRFAAELRAYIPQCAHGRGFNTPMRQGLRPLDTMACLAEHLAEWCPCPKCAQDQPHKPPQPWERKVGEWKRGE